MPMEESVDLSRLWESETTRVFERALESSVAETLHDLARNSMDSVGVSGWAQDTVSQLAGQFSSMFSSRGSEHLEAQELTATNI